MSEEAARPQQPHEAVYELFDGVISFAQGVLPENEDLVPFARVAHADGRQGVVAATAGGEIASTEELLETLLAGLRQSFASGDIVRSALCLDGRIRDPEDGAAHDALLIWVEAPGEEELKLVVPYTRLPGGGIDMSDGFRVPGEAMVFG